MVLQSKKKVVSFPLFSKTVHKTHHSKLQLNLGLSKIGVLKKYCEKERKIWKEQ